MKKANLKTKTTALVLAVMMTVAILPLMTLHVSAAVSYTDRDKCVKWAYDNAYNGDGTLCAEFVANALAQGGIKLPNIEYTSYNASSGGRPSGNVRTWVPSQFQYLIDQGNQVIYKKDGISAKDVDIGDLIYWAYDGVSHVAIVTGKDTDGTPLISQHNSAKRNERWFHLSSIAAVVKIGTNTIDSGSSLKSANVPDGWYVIASKLNTNKCVDIKGASKENGATTLLWDYSGNGNENQQFYFERLSDGTYRIKAKHSGLYLEVRNSSHNNLAEIAQWDWHANYACKRWYVIDAGGGYYTLVNKESSKAMDVNGAQSASGTKISQYERNGTDAQKFKLVPVSTNPYPVPTRWLYWDSPMIRGDDVKYLQWGLNRLGFNCGDIDGIFGGNTHNALVSFQKAYGLDADGIFGPKSLSKMQSLIK